MTSALEIKSMLLSRGAEPTQHGVKIKCPWHAGGAERTASLFVNIDNTTYPPGTFNCFGCSPKRSGSWLELGAKLGFHTGHYEEQPHASVLTDHNLDTLLKEDSQDRKHHLLLKEPLFSASEKWRNIKGKLLRELKARVTRIQPSSDDLFWEDRVYLPIMQHQEWRSGIYCSYSKTAKIKYLNEPGTQTSKILFPYDYVVEELRYKPKRSRTVVLVEGPRDALNLIQHGILAWANLGVLQFGQKIK